MIMMKNEEKKCHFKNDKVKHDKHVLLNDNDKQEMINMFYFIILKLRLLGRKTLFDRMY